MAARLYRESAKAFGPAWMGWTVAALFVLLGRFGEAKDAIEILGENIPVPPQWMFYIAAFVAAAVGSFLPFHRVNVQALASSSSNPSTRSGHSTSVRKAKSP